ncbi:DgyrCDS1478 [Dimorphilus gyrociliatus]|uniref:DgyrCDS1478 n=1 Tax=Dimorphilus gyrociliatus TaxID=2664684 RepID=A0A7I8V7D1_9ANNE|nr:DgyrCDS1478 [Dimorphilus gyrociliatus]
MPGKWVNSDDKGQVLLLGTTSGADQPRFYCARYKYTSGIHHLSLNIAIIEQAECKEDQDYLSAETENSIGFLFIAPDSPCDLNTCKNGGTCIPNGKLYSCQCPTSFNGENCEFGNAVCNPNPCKNGGKCIVKVDDYSCECQYGYSSKNCETPPSVCQNINCNNGGICMPTSNGGYTCKCPVGYQGDSCRQPVCNPSPCLNNGICEVADSTLGYYCRCTQSFTGSRCQENIGICENNKCQAGGTCQVEPDNSYSCKCRTDRGGSLCEFPTKQLISKHSVNDKEMYFIELNSITKHKECIRIINLDNMSLVWKYTLFGVPNAFAYQCPNYMTSTDSFTLQISYPMPVIASSTCPLTEGTYATIVSYNGASNYCRQDSSSTTIIKGNKITFNTCLTNNPYKEPFKQTLICLEKWPRSYIHSATNDWGDFILLEPQTSTEAPSISCISNEKICENSGTCIRKDGKPVCVCLDGFDGDNCEITLEMGSCTNACNPAGVQNCETKGAYFRCYCKENYTGILCEKELLTGRCSSVNECNKQTSVRCNQVDYEKSFYNCECLGSYGGSRCEHYMLEGECKDTACHKDTTEKCMQVWGNKHYCVCKTGYGNSLCQHELVKGNCTESKCDQTNTENCEQQQSSENYQYYCKCKDGYAGKFCTATLVTGKCLGSNQCISDNTIQCVNHLQNSFFCDCKSGWIGRNCSEFVGELCSPSPCLNKGVCIQKGGDFECKCNTKYKGSTCSEPVEIEEDDTSILEGRSLVLVIVLCAVLVFVIIAIVAIAFIIKRQRENNKARLRLTSRLASQENIENRNNHGSVSSSASKWYPDYKSADAGTGSLRSQSSVVYDAQTINQNINEL